MENNTIINKQILNNTKQDRAYFQNYRNEILSRLLPLQYNYDGVEKIYVTQANMYLLDKQNNLDKFLFLPQSKFTMLDIGRQKEIDNFYIACQKYRDHYKDIYQQLHPFDYFHIDEYNFQCAPNPISKYLKSPVSYVKYKQPLVLPLTLERCVKHPQLPERALTGIYNRCNDHVYKR